jgi:hypothetical protein
MKKLLIAHQGENRRAADVSPHCGACEAGCGDFASPGPKTAKEAR